MPNAAPLLIRPRRTLQEAKLCARLMARSEPWITLRRTYAQALALLTDRQKEVYVARVGGRFVGFIVLHLGGPFSGYLQTVGVTPEWRGRGVGTKLIAFAETRIFRDSPNVFLCVSSFNKAARRLYRRLGYERVGELKGYLVGDHSEILMRKSLGPLSGFKPPRQARLKKKRG